MKLVVKGRYTVFDNNIICRMLMDIGYHNFTNYKNMLFSAKVVELEDSSKFHFFCSTGRNNKVVKLTTHTLPNCFTEKYINSKTKIDYKKFDNEEFVYFTGYTIAQTKQKHNAYIYTGITESYVSYDNLIHIPEVNKSLSGTYKQIKNKYVTYSLPVIEGNDLGSASICLYEHDPFKIYNAISNLYAAYPQDDKYEEDGLGAISIYGDCFIRMSSADMTSIRDHRRYITQLLLTGNVKSR